MKLLVTLGCSICGFNNERSVILPFDCDRLLCPKCGESNCLSIISVLENADLQHGFMVHDAIQDLYRIRKL